MTNTNRAEILMISDDAVRDWISAITIGLAFFLSMVRGHRSSRATGTTPSSAFSSAVQARICQNQMCRRLLECEVPARAAISGIIPTRAESAWNVRKRRRNRSRRRRRARGMGSRSHPYVAPTNRIEPGGADRQ